MKGMHEIVGEVGTFFESSPEDAVGLLKADHRKVEGLFRQFEKARTAANKQKIVDSIIQELTVHTKIEEELVYPFLEESDEQKVVERTQQADEEHHLLKMALVELARIPAASEMAKPKVKVISELVKHHVKDEESYLLPRLRDCGLDMEELATAIMERKQEIIRGIKKGIGKSKDVKVTTAKSRSRASSVRKAASKTKPSVSRAARTGTKTSARKARKAATGRRRSAA